MSVIKKKIRGYKFALRKVKLLQMFTFFTLIDTSTEDLQKLVKDKDKKIVEMLEEINKLSNIEVVS